MSVIGFKKNCVEKWSLKFCEGYRANGFKAFFSFIQADAKDQSQQISSSRIQRTHDPFPAGSVRFGRRSFLGWRPSRQHLSV